VIWFLERDTQLIACEVRRGSDGAYEYEVTTPTGTASVTRFDHPTRFIDGYLREQQALLREGWRPRMIRASW